PSRGSPVLSRVRTHAWPRSSPRVDRSGDAVGWWVGRVDGASGGGRVRSGGVAVVAEDGGGACLGGVVDLGLLVEAFEEASRGLLLGLLAEGRLGALLLLLLGDDLGALAGGLDHRLGEGLVDL